MVELRKVAELDGVSARRRGLVAQFGEGVGEAIPLIWLGAEKGGGGPGEMRNRGKQARQVAGTETRRGLRTEQAHGIARIRLSEPFQNLEPASGLNLESPQKEVAALRISPDGDQGRAALGHEHEPHPSFCVAVGLGCGAGDDGLQRRPACFEPAQVAGEIERDRTEFWSGRRGVLPDRRSVSLRSPRCGGGRPSSRQCSHSCTRLARHAPPSGKSFACDDRTRKSIAGNFIVFRLKCFDQMPDPAKNHGKGGLMDRVGRSSRP